MLYVLMRVYVLFDLVVFPLAVAGKRVSAAVCRQCRRDGRDRLSA